MSYSCFSLKNHCECFYGCDKQHFKQGRRLEYNEIRPHGAPKERVPKMPGDSLGNDIMSCLNKDGLLIRFTGEDCIRKGRITAGENEHAHVDFVNQTQLTVQLSAEMKSRVRNHAIITDG